MKFLNNKMPINDVFLATLLLTGILSTVLSSCSQYDRSEDNKSPEALFRVAESLRASGDYSSAARLYDQAVTANPKYSDARLGLGKTLRTTKDYDEAITVFKDELIRNPKSSEGLKELGKTYINANMGEDGVQTYGQLLEINAQDPWALNGLAICHDLCGRHTQAHEYYEKALHELPNNVNIQSNYGLSLALGGKFNESIEFLEKINSTVTPTPNLRHNLAVVYALSGKHDKSRDLFSKDLSPVDVEQNLSSLMISS